MTQSQVLARKWRPKSFVELTGQNHVVKVLTHALKQNRLHHAYLFTGTRGVGKTTIARIFAKALNCETGVTATPCETCSACISINEGNFVDLIELDAASNTQVDNMRELLENALYVPTCARYKIYIIDEVHMLSKSAFNAMLKTLEEPPDHVKFILATTDPQKIPATVLSRCLQFNLKQIPQAQIITYLENILGQENITYDAASLQLLARAAQGSMRDALSMLDQAIAFGQGQVEEAGVREMLGAVDQNYLYDLLDVLNKKDGVQLLKIADDMEARSLSFDAALQDLAALLHQIALAQTVPQVISEDVLERSQILTLAKSYSPDDIQLFYQIVLHGRKDLSLAPDEYAGFTMTLMRMLTFMPEIALASDPPKNKKSASIDSQPKSIPTVKNSKLNTQEETAIQACADDSLRQTDRDWPSLVGKLKLTGMAKMLAQHSEARFLSADKIELYVPEIHKHLLDKKYQDKIKAAVNIFYEKSVPLKFFVGSITGMTPAALQQQQKETRQTEAVKAIETDPIVQELVENFDAKIITSSIKPVN